MKERIWKSSLGYDFIRAIVIRSAFLSYRRIEKFGEENIPTDGAVIFAPNHCNTLMDPMVLLVEHSGPIAFGARADVFRKPAIAKMLNFLRIVPMVRMRDGLSNVLKNYETIDDVTGVLAHGVPYCMFCEGTHRPKHSLMPVTKGIMRIAFAANEYLAGSKPVYIVPVGLNYEDYFRYRSNVLVTFGEPINVSAYLKDHADASEAENYMKLRELLGQRISGLITYLPDDESYDARWALLKVRTAPLKGNLHDRMLKAREEIAKPVDGYTLDAALAFEQKRHAAGISSHAFTAGCIAGRTLAWLICLPFFLLAAVLMLPAWGIGEFLCYCKIKDKAFGNSIRFIMRFAGALILIPVWAIVAFCTMNWIPALALTAYTCISYSIFYDYIEFSRRLISQWRLKFNPSLKKEWESLR